LIQKDFKKDIDIVAVGRALALKVSALLLKTKDFPKVIWRFEDT
jgi:hypothetical protein